MTKTVAFPLECQGIQFPENDDVLTQRVRRKLNKGSYELPESKSLHRFLTSDSRVLELGGGIGFISSFCCKIGVEAITTIEANPVLCDYIRDVHVLNDITNANVINGVAMTDQQARGDSTMSFYVTDPFWSSSLAKPSGLPFEEIRVPVHSLSDIINDSRANVIVCDIEGGELDLFEDTDLGRVNHVFMELHTRRYGGRGVIRIFEAMHKQGFFYHQKISGHDVCLFQRLGPHK